MKSVVLSDTPDRKIAAQLSPQRRFPAVVATVPSIDAGHGGAACVEGLGAADAFGGADYDAKPCGISFDFDDTSHF